MGIFLNETGTIGVIIKAGTDLTGSLFLTVLLIFLALVVLALMFKLPLEILAPIVLPIFIVSMAYSTEFLAIGGLLLIYLAVVFSKQFWLNR